MSTLYRRGNLWWYKERLPSHSKPLYLGLKMKDRRMAKLKQQQLDRVLTEMRLPQSSWSFIDDLQLDAQLRELVGKLCEMLGVSLNFQMRVPIVQALKEYEADSSMKKTPRTHKTDWSRVTGFFKYAGCQYLHEARSSHLQDYIAYRVRCEEITKATANHTLEALRTFFNFCIRRGLASVNPASKVEGFKVPLVPQHYLKTPDEIVQLLEAAKRTDPALYPMVAAAVYTGCRLGELMALEWEDVDFLFRKVMIKDKPHLGLRTKTGRFRVIPLHPDLATILKPLRKDSGFVFLPERTQSRKYTRPLCYRWMAIRKAAKQPDTTWYSLRRRSAATSPCLASRC